MTRVLHRAHQALALVPVLLATMTAPALGQCPERSEAVCLPHLFQDGMVLQRDVPVPVWGWAVPGTEVQVSLGGRTQTVTASTGGEWSVLFPPLAAGAVPVFMVSGGGRTLTIHNVLAGDVWVASGQSNMEWPLARDANGSAAVAAANDQLFREFAVPHSWSERPEHDLVDGSWALATSPNAGRFSAIAYYFARELRAGLGVPIGIIHTSWGGANIETWMSPQALELSDSAYQAVLQQERDRQAGIREELRARLGELPARDSGLADGRAPWADPALDDSGWTTLPVPSLWEQAGFTGLDGTAWYRTSFTLSESEARQGLRISLGTIDDDDITWVNGAEAGRTAGYAEPRRYRVPATVLRPGVNVLAVRVVDGGGGGGLYGAADSFYVEVGGVRRPLPRVWKFRVGSVALQPDGQRINKIPAVLYNRMLHPLLRYPIKGVIWYQGESNANNDAQAAAYRSLFTNLVQGWRREWLGNQVEGGTREFPFLWVQLPNFGTPDSVPPARAAWALLRESQTAALALPNTAQAVAIDLGDPADIHPRNKQPVGHRLALAAARVAYGKPVVASGPVYRGQRVNGARITVEFDHGGAGLASRSGDLTVSGFAVAGEDRRWVWAEAVLDGDRVAVWSPEVSRPVAVRYAWSNSPRAPGLLNRDGLPAAPFRSDDW